MTGRPPPRRQGGQQPCMILPTPTTCSETVLTASSHSAAATTTTAISVSLHRPTRSNGWSYRSVYYGFLFYYMALVGCRSEAFASSHPPFRRMGGGGWISPTLGTSASFGGSCGSSSGSSSSSTTSCRTSTSTSTTLITTGMPTSPVIMGRPTPPTQRTDRFVSGTTTFLQGLGGGGKPDEQEKLIGGGGVGTAGGGHLPSASSPTPSIHTTTTTTSTVLPPPPMAPRHRYRSSTGLRGGSTAASTSSSSLLLSSSSASSSGAVGTVAEVGSPSTRIMVASAIPPRENRHHAKNNHHSPNNHHTTNKNNHHDHFSGKNHSVPPPPPSEKTTSKTTPVTTTRKSKMFSSLPPLVVPRETSSRTSSSVVSSASSSPFIMSEDADAAVSSSSSTKVYLANGKKVNKMTKATTASSATTASTSTTTSTTTTTLSSYPLRNGDRNGIIDTTTTTTPSSSTTMIIPSVPVDYVAETKLPTALGQFQLRAYRIPGKPMGQEEPCVIYARDKPPFGQNEQQLAYNVPVRVHDQCLTSEVFGSQRCDCREQLEMAMQYILEHGGCIIYLQQEGRGIGLANKIAAYELQDDGFDTVDANLHLGLPEDAREYGVVPSILRDLKIGSIQLLTNNPRKVEILHQHGIRVDGTVPMVVPEANPHNRRYLETKRERMNHMNMDGLLVPSFTPSLSASSSTISSFVASESTIDTAGNSADLTPADAEVQVSMSVVESTSATTSMLGSAPSSSGSIATAAAGTPPNAAVDEEGITVTIDPIDNDINGEGDVDDMDFYNADEADGVTASSDGYCFGRQSVLDAIAAIARGEMVVVVDDMNRENEGDFIMAASKCTAPDMARIVRYSSGVVCVGMEGDRMDALGIPAMVTRNEDPKGTAFGVSVDAAMGISTGISAADRALTIQLLANPTSTASDFCRPGHIFPLRARPGGVLTRDGHTEAAVDLSRLAGLEPCGVLCEIVSEEYPTEMMRLPELRRFCRRHGFILTSIVDIKQYRKETEEL